MATERAKPTNKAKAAPAKVAAATSKSPAPARVAKAARKPAAAKATEPEAKSAPRSRKVIATDGRVIGRRAEQTRRRLLDATAELLEEYGALDLRVIDIARAIDASAATFYQYFVDVEDAIVALAEEAGDEVTIVEPHLRVTWGGPDGLEHARALAGAFMAYWDRHQAILRVRNLKSEEGDIRFRRLRQRSYLTFMNLLVDKVEAGQAAGRLSTSLDAYATAGAMMAVLERLTAFHREFERRGVSRDQLIETVARLLYENLTGRVADERS
jgi:AcrR family transcriptional regulator